jgi:hypothetical protein
VDNGVAAWGGAGNEGGADGEKEQWEREGRRGWGDWIGGRKWEIGVNGRYSRGRKRGYDQTGFKFGGTYVWVSRQNKEDRKRRTGKRKIYGYLKHLLKHVMVRSDADSRC